MILRTLAILLILLASGILLFFLVSCLVYFPRQYYSTDLSDLADYGDFFGGILGVIISTFSLGVTIYLAHILQIRDGAIALSQIKLDEYRHFKENVDPSFTLWKKDPNIIQNYEAFEYNLTSAIDRITTLFPNSEDTLFALPLLKDELGKTRTVLRSNNFGEVKAHEVVLNYTYQVFIRQLGRWVLDRSIHKF